MKKQAAGKKVAPKLQQSATTVKKVDAKKPEVAKKVIEKPPPEPPKPKENFKLKHLQAGWAGFQLEKDVKMVRIVY